MGVCFMQFKLWSISHFIYMLSPFLMFTIIYLLVRRKSDKVKNVVGFILGFFSIVILVARNVDIYIRSGWDSEIIPLQVCHIGSLIAGLALIFKKKWLIVTAFSFNMLLAFLAMIFADSLVNYDTLLKIRPQAYIWGHIFIVVCALYGVLVYRPLLDKKDLKHSLFFISIVAGIAIVCNSLFRYVLSWEPNYFYLYNYEGTPLKFLYKTFPSSTYGWFEINWFYVIVLLTFFTFVFIAMYQIAKLCIKSKNEIEK